MPINPFTHPNRFLSLSIFSLFGVAFLFPLSSTAQFTYTAIDDGAAIEITGYTGEGGNVIIPSTIDNLPVTSIGNKAFYKCSTITSVTIPDPVIRIGEYSFYSCKNLTGVALSNRLTAIGMSAFCRCDSLAAVAIPGRVTSIGSLAFSYCKSLTSMTFPASVTEIGSLALTSCPNLASVFVEEGNPNYSSQDGLLFNKDRTSILYCPGGKTGTYAVPDGVIEIRAGSFNECANLRGIIIPASVTKIGTNPFERCSSLTEIVVDEQNPNYTSRDGVLFDKSMTQIICFPGAKKGDYSIPDGVIGISDYSFTACAGLTGLSIPESVTQIGIWVFSECTGLTRVDLPNRLTSLPGWIFDGCTGLSEVIIPESIISIGAFAFYGCTNLPRITIPDQVTQIGNLAFSGCSRLTEIAIPARVTKMGNSAFSSCANLASAYFYGDAPTEWGTTVFSKCAADFSIYYLESKSGWTTPTWNGYPAWLFTNVSFVINWEAYGQ